MNIRMLGRKPGAGRFGFLHSLARNPVLRARYAGPTDRVLGGGTAERVVEYAPFPSQRRFHELNARFKGFSGPVGSGKTEAAVYEALNLAYTNPGRMGLIGAATYRLLADVTRLAFLAKLQEHQIPHTFLKSENAVYLPECGSTVIFRSLHEPYRLVGPNLAWFGCDELTYAPEDSWRRLEARVRDPKARRLCGFGCWTPNGTNWVYQRFVGPNRIPGYEVVLASPFENRAVLEKTPDYYDRLKASYDERFYRQEVLGEYVNQFAGTVYYNFSETENVRPAAYNPALPLYWTLDFNVAPLCSLICQVEHLDEQRGVHRVTVLDEIALQAAYTPEACEEFARRVGPWISNWQRFEVYLYGDPAGCQRHPSASKTDWEHVRAFFDLRPAFRIHDHVARAAPAVKDRTNSVNWLCKTAGGERMLWIDPKCKELIADLRENSWALDRHENVTGRIDKTNPKRTHCADALGYLTWGLHELGVAGYMPGCLF